MIITITMIIIRRVEPTLFSHSWLRALSTVSSGLQNTMSRQFNSSVLCHAPTNTSAITTTSTNTNTTTNNNNTITTNTTTTTSAIKKNTTE